MLNDILKEERDSKEQFSIGRTILFVTFIVYFSIILGAFLGGMIESLKISKEDLESIKTALKSIEYVLLIFSGYVLGTKGTKVVENIKKEKKRKLGKPS